MRTALVVMLTVGTAAGCTFFGYILGIASAYASPGVGR